MLTFFCRYIAHSCNFFLFPTTFGILDSEFSFQASSVQFLNQYGFDYNKVRHGGGRRGSEGSLVPFPSRSRPCETGRGRVLSALLPTQSVAPPASLLLLFLSLVSQTWNPLHERRAGEANQTQHPDWELESPQVQPRSGAWWGSPGLGLRASECGDLACPLSWGGVWPALRRTSLLLVLGTPSPRPGGSSLP